MKRSPLKRGKSRLGRSKSPKSQARRVADYLWGTIVLKRDRKCVYCGNPASDPHHIFCKKQCPKVRYEPVNGIGLCGGCHKWKAHGNPEMYRHLNIKHVGGREEYEKLAFTASLPSGKPDYQLIEMFLWQELGENQPEEWSTWKEYKKIEYLREIRRLYA